VIAKIDSVCREIRKGNFEARITNINEDGMPGDVQHQVNDVIDRCDAFIREATASLDAVCRNVYYRRIELAGLQGSYRVAAEMINASIEAQRKAVERAGIEATARQTKIIDLLAQGLTNLAGGNLTFRITGFPEDCRQIQDDFNGAVAQLQETIRDIALSSSEISNAASEISVSTTDLSQRTEEQAASLEETSASMEEFSVTVKKNAENARHANELTRNTGEVADRGGKVVADAVAAMTRIEDSSRKISDIISVIDEIARQTNLLALNAAVEAARAGEAGRGFAVVASEVRSLAQRSSQAAKDIKDLITNSSSQVQDGVQLVNRAGASLHEILGSIKQVTDIVSDIATASSEQADGIEQINKALVQMDEVTQQNSALVEENAATAKTLEDQQSAMNDRVGFFRFEQGEEDPEGAEFGAGNTPGPAGLDGLHAMARRMRAADGALPSVRNPSAGFRT
jgi:methyl-accepting chemotaxis protein